MTIQQYQKCIDACLECATECNQCAVACLEEKEVQNLTQCIRLDLECAVICRASAELMTTGSAYAPQLCELCAAICNACAEKCEQNANMGMEHCRECAEACRTCARETMEVAKESVNKNQFIHHQDECAILSRATAELMSLESTWAKQIGELNTIVCNAAADMLQKEVNGEMEHCSKCAAVAKEAHQHLEMQDNEFKKDKATESKDKEQPLQQKETIKKKKKHSSALLAASMGRSAVDWVHAHSSSTIRGRSGLANTGTIITYEADE